MQEVVNQMQTLLAERHEMLDFLRGFPNNSKEAVKGSHSSQADHVLIDTRSLGKPHVFNDDNKF